MTAEEYKNHWENVYETKNQLTLDFDAEFKKIDCKTHNHITPFQTTQNFLFCSFQQKNMI